MASGSPRRKELLAGLGLVFEICKSDLDEQALVHEQATDTALRLAVQKASQVAANNPNAWVLGADTLVVIGEKVLGKPNSRDEAFEMLKGLQGNTHLVYSAFALMHKAKALNHSEIHASKVKMLPLSANQIWSYIETKEPMDKAGAYAIQGVGAALIEEVQGSYTNVVGLNLSAVLKALIKFRILDA